MSKIKVFLVEDHSIVRNGLKLLLESSEHFEVCGDAECIAEALELIPKACPDVIILDLKLPDGDGVSACQEIKKRYSAGKILILTAYAEKHIVLEAVKSGAEGYLLKSAESNILFDSVKKIHNGLCILDPNVTGNVIKEVKSVKQDDDNLTDREKNILDLLSIGKTNKEIGVDLDLAEKSVRNYISLIFKKINVTNRTEAARYWMRKNVFE